MRSRAWIALVGLLVPALAGAHALAPSLIDVRETRLGVVEVRWRTPALRAPGSELGPLFPARCRMVGTPAMEVLDATAIETRWTLDCGAASLVGERIGASDIAASRADVLVRVALADGRRFQTVLTPESPDFAIPAEESRVAVGLAYGKLGVTHILSGWDHLLFVIGLVLLVPGRRQLLQTVTAFTLGHSVTLSLAVLGFVRVPQAPAEAMIALSIFVLAVELARDPARAPTRLRRRPWAMAAAFGLLHGLGFAGALTEAGLPAEAIPLALASFNLGIELGQLAIVAAAVALRSGLGRLPWRWPEPLLRVPAYVIGSLAAAWLYERVALTLHGLAS